jgi:hypothetical protein
MRNRNASIDRIITDVASKLKSTTYVRIISVLEDIRKNPFYGNRDGFISIFQIRMKW